MREAKLPDRRVFRTLARYRSANTKELRFLVKVLLRFFPQKRKKRKGKMNETFDPFVEEKEERGPRGGDLNHTYNKGKPVWRKESFHGEQNGDGTYGLHRFVRDHDSVAPGKKNEQPWHRMAAYMLNAGRTNSEIALAAEVVVATVSHLRAQKWFQELCATIANANGEELLGALNGYALESIEAIHEIATDDRTDDEGRPLVNARTRLQAHVTLLEHAHGKPIQKVISDVSHRVAASPTEEMEMIQNELAALRPQPKPLELPPPCQQ